MEKREKRGDEINRHMFGLKKKKDDILLNSFVFDLKNKKKLFTRCFGLFFIYLTVSYSFKK